MIMSQIRDSRDTQAKQIQEHISHVEKYFGKLCQHFAGYVRKTARLRDKADLLVQEIGLYADTENPSLKNGLQHFADHLAKIQDYRQAQVERLDTKVVQLFKGYGHIVKLKMEDLKLAQSAWNQEAKQMQQLKKTRQKNPSDRHLNSQAERELQRATTHAMRATRQLKKTIDLLERQKIRDIKKIFGRFVTVEMAFHAKALEVYTTAYQHIQNVDEEADLEVFWSLMNPSGYQSRLDIVSPNSRASLNHTSTGRSISGTLQSKTIKGQKEEAEEDKEQEEKEEEEEEKEEKEEEEKEEEEEEEKEEEEEEEHDDNEKDDDLEDITDDDE